jgi:hypothetical protein
MARLLCVDEARAAAGFISITIVRQNEDGRRMMLHVLLFITVGVLVLYKRASSRPPERSLSSF